MHLDSDFRAFDRAGGTGELEDSSSDPYFDSQSSRDSGDGLSHRQNLLEDADVAEQPVRVPLVVSHALCGAC